MEFLGFQLTFDSIIGIVKLLLSIVVFIGANQYMMSRHGAGRDAPEGFFERERYLYRRASKTAQSFFLMAAGSLVLIAVLEVLF